MRTHMTAAASSITLTTTEPTRTISTGTVTARGPIARATTGTGSTPVGGTSTPTITTPAGARRSGTDTPPPSTTAADRTATATRPVRPSPPRQLLDFLDRVHAFDVPHDPRALGLLGLNDARTRRERHLAELA